MKTTVANYLKYFTDPDIMEVFCPEKSTFNFEDIDRGKIICISIAAAVRRSSGAT